jgi:transposase-like protein
MVLEHQGEHHSQYGAIRSIAAKIGCSGETLRNWVRQAERDQGQRASPTTDERERIKELLTAARDLWRVLPEIEEESDQRLVSRMTFRLIHIADILAVTPDV